jgi:hypothetical protein
VNQADLRIEQRLAERRDAIYDALKVQKAS